MSTSSTSPPNPPKLVAKAKKCKGYKTVEAICNQIDNNARWCNGQTINDSVMKVLLDATNAMAIVHQRYENCDMAEVARKFFNGEEDDWADFAWSSLNRAWLHVVKGSPDFVTKDVLRTLGKISWGDFEGMNGLENSAEYKQLAY